MLSALDVAGDRVSVAAKRTPLGSIQVDPGLKCVEAAGADAQVDASVASNTSDSIFAQQLLLQHCHQQLKICSMRLPMLQHLRAQPCELL